MFLNCTFSGNSAGEGGAAIFNRDADVFVFNSILWNNCPVPFEGDEDHRNVVTHSIVEGGLEQTTEFFNRFFIDEILDVPPRFVDEANGDFHLTASSPAIDSGTPTLAQTVEDTDFPVGLAAPTQDLDGVARPQGIAIDIGAYEFVSGSTGDGADESRCPGEGEGEGEGPECFASGARVNGPAAHATDGGLLLMLAAAMYVAGLRRRATK